MDCVTYTVPVPTVHTHTHTHTHIYIYIHISKSMFPLSCARTSCETNAHKKTWSAHICSFKNCFCTYFIIEISRPVTKLHHPPTLEIFKSAHKSDVTRTSLFTGS